MAPRVTWDGDLSNAWTIVSIVSGEMTYISISLVLRAIYKEVEEEIELQIASIQDTGAISNQENRGNTWTQILVVDVEKWSKETRYGHQRNDY